MIRLDGAVNLASALRNNSSLTYIDISFNSLGKEGGEMLGDSILDNKTLLTLKISNNSLNSTACFTICVGIEENFVLREVALNDNPIGIFGAKALLEIPVTCGSRLKVSADRCNISLHESNFPFDRMDLTGQRTLDLSKPFERAIAFKILQIVATQSSYKFALLRYEPPSVKSRVVAAIDTAAGSDRPITARGKDIKLVRNTFSHTKIQFMSESQKKVLESLKNVSRAAKDFELAAKLFMEFDSDGSGSLDKNELSQLLNELGVDVDEKVLGAAMAQFDIDGAGTLELPEFLSFLRMQHDEAVSRIREMVETHVMCLANNPTERYIPPRRGFLHIGVIDLFHVDKGSEKVLTAFDYANINKLVNASSMDVITGIMYAIKNVKLRHKEAYEVYEKLFVEIRDRSKTLELLLPLMLDPLQARALVKDALKDNQIEMSKLKSYLGCSLRYVYCRF